jgi:hypothetical protein
MDSIVEHEIQIQNIARRVAAIEAVLNKVLVAAPEPGEATEVPGAPSAEPVPSSLNTETAPTVKEKTAVSGPPGKKIISERK